MKLQSVLDSGIYLSKVKEKSEKDELTQHQQKQNLQDNNQKKQQESEDTFDKAMNNEKLASEVSQYALDEQLQNLGIQASIQGNGPGLKVVLKDGKGAVIRQFTGEEFIELRKMTENEDRKNGKILDLKL